MNLFESEDFIQWHTTVKGSGRDCDDQKQTPFDGEGHMGTAGTSMVLYHFWPPPFGFISHLGYPYPMVAQFITPQEMPVYGLWKEKNCQIAGKCIDTIFTISKFVKKLTTFPYTKRALQTTTLLLK